jgi:hypothetical protein
MSANRYAPPDARVQDPPNAAVPRPRSVAIAVALLWFDLALGIPQWYLTAQQDGDIAFHPVVIAATLALMALAAVLNICIYRGRNWARIATLLLTLLAVLLYFLPSERPQTVTEFSLSAASWVAEIGALILLFIKPAAPWFRNRTD